MNTWKINLLIDFVEKRDKTKDSVAILNSIERTIQIFRYHFFIARDCMKPYNEIDFQTSFRNTLNQERDKDEFDEKLLEHEANMIAMIQTVRNMYDIFAQVVNKLILLNHFKEHTCDFQKVVAKLDNTELKNKLYTLQNSYWFKYIEAFVNTTKHRKLISQYYEQSIESEKASVIIDAFNYRENNFKKHTSLEVIQGVLEVKNIIIYSGNELNNILLK